MAVITRFLLGSMNALLGTIMHYPTYATEVMREEHQALGLSAVSTAWGIGLIMAQQWVVFLAQVSILLALLCYITYCFGSNYGFLLASGT
ncbi:hypothetical protein Pint_05490 [Pistacia integerrima]|uniref:Uncharacterized protein n=1 Tax=Pistacia integerrima TaxID=434235 RepID=A0ACC0Z701_9ROSI|nr:hypothetical protein Pint_05490 [Pistacia integerrima]